MTYQDGDITCEKDDTDCSQLAEAWGTISAKKSEIKDLLWVFKRIRFVVDNAGYSNETKLSMVHGILRDSRYDLRPETQSEIIDLNLFIRDARMRLERNSNIIKESYGDPLNPPDPLRPFW